MLERLTKNIIYSRRIGDHKTMMERNIVIEVTFTDYINYKNTHTRADYIKAIRKMRADAQKESCGLKKCTGKCKCTI
jgi:hypothetical protein